MLLSEAGDQNSTLRVVLVLLGGRWVGLLGRK